MKSVKVRLGFTQNLGDYESARADVEIERTFEDGVDDDEAFDMVYDEVESRLIKAATESYESLTKSAKRKTNINP